MASPLVATAHPRERTLPRPSWTLAAAIALTAGGLLEVLSTVSGKGQLVDFFGYWIEGRVSLRFGFAHTYDQSLINLVAGEAGAQRLIVSPMSPVLVWLVTPLAPLPLPLAETIWALLLLAAFVVVAALLAPGAGDVRALCGAAALAWPPLALGIAFGNGSVIVLASLALGAWLLRRGRPELAGLAFAGMLVKPHLALLLPVALLFAPRALAAFAAAGAAFVLAAALSLGSHGIEAYLQQLALTRTHPELFYVPRDLSLWGLFGGGFAAIAAAAAVCAAVFWAAWRERSRGPLEVALPAAMVAALLILPFLHVYDAGLLAPVAWLRLAGRPRKVELAALGFVAAAGLLATAAPALLLLAEVCWFSVLLLAPRELKSMEAA